MHPRKFTDITIQTTPLPAEGRTYLWDASSPLGLQISSTGVKTFVVILGRRRKTIGQYGHITLKMARDAAKQLKAEQTLGRLLPSSRSLAGARAEYLKAITVRANTLRYYERNLLRLPDCRLADVNAADLNRILDKLGSTSRSQALRSFIAFFNWCIRRHYLDVSPCIRFRPDRAAPRDRVLTDHELKSIWLACEANRGKALVGEQREPLLGDPPPLPASYCAIVKLLILTGQRKNEIASLQSSWIKDNKITFPKEITKNGRQHTIPITQMALDVMAVPSKFSTTAFLFPGQDTSKPFNSWSNTKAVLDKASGVTDWTLHDLRRTFATRLAELGVAPHVIERLLNHVTGTLSPIALVYNRASFMKEMRAAIDLWEAKLMTLIK
jgi:integrase